MRLARKRCAKNDTGERPDHAQLGSDQSASGLTPDCVVVEALVRRQHQVPNLPDSQTLAGGSIAQSRPLTRIARAKVVGHQSLTDRPSSTSQKEPDHAATIILLLQDVSKSLIAGRYCWKNRRLPSTTSRSRDIGWLSAHFLSGTAPTEWKSRTALDFPTVSPDNQKLGRSISCQCSAKSFAAGRARSPV
jgi:hypothetical protein